MYKIIEVDKFKKDIKKLLSKKELQEFEKQKQKLREGKLIGKKLIFDFFRELKIEGKRIYFLIYEDIAIIMFINASNKKHQQETIDEIKLFLPEYKKLAEDIYRMFKK